MDEMEINKINKMELFLALSILDIPNGHILFFYMPKLALE